MNHKVSKQNTQRIFAIRGTLSDEKQKGSENVSRKMFSIPILRLEKLHWQPKIIHQNMILELLNERDQLKRANFQLQEEVNHCRSIQDHFQLNILQKMELPRVEQASSTNHTRMNEIDAPDGIPTVNRSQVLSGYGLSKIERPVILEHFPSERVVHHTVSNSEESSEAICVIAPVNVEQKGIGKSSQNSAEKPHLCDLSFRRKAYLSEHLKIHTGEKSHLCTVCKKSFTRKSNLSRHLKIHSDENPYLCELCSKSFQRKDHLSDHLKYHIGTNQLKDQLEGVFKEPLS